MRPDRIGEWRTNKQFQFTHPGRGATQFHTLQGQDIQVSIHAPREGCDERRSSSPPRRRVSIHAPREGCDARQLQRVTSPGSFNSRTPGGVRPLMSSILSNVSPFQFTHPGRGATRMALPLLPVVGFQFTHPGRGATGKHTTAPPLSDRFNSRTPGGVRQMPAGVGGRYRGFQFTHPGRGATVDEEQQHVHEGVSIHAPREGCD